MATKQENRELVVELSAELDIEFDVPEVDDLKAAEWAKMVSDLKAKKRDKDNETAVDDAEETPAAPTGKTYFVKPGCAITSRKGVLSTDKGVKTSECTKVDPAWIIGGAETLDKLVESGHLGKK